MCGLTLSAISRLGPGPLRCLVPSVRSLLAKRRAALFAFERCAARFEIKAALLQAAFSLASRFAQCSPRHLMHHPGFIKHLERPRRIGTLAFAWSPKGALDAGLVADRTMEKAVPYAISALLVGFGALILIVGLSSSSPALWTLVALIPITIGIVSAFGPM